MRLNRDREMMRVNYPGEIVAMMGQTIDELLAAGNSDAAFLYLWLLRRGNLDGIPWPVPRQQTALQCLQQYGLAPASVSAAAPAMAEPGPPEYETGDITHALAEADSPFPALVSKVEDKLGKRLSPMDLKRLYTIYDHYALPAEVILILVDWCIEKASQKFGAWEIQVVRNA